MPQFGILGFHFEIVLEWPDNNEQSTLLFHDLRTYSTNGRQLRFRLVRITTDAASIRVA